MASNSAPQQPVHVLTVSAAAQREPQAATRIGDKVKSLRRPIVMLSSLLVLGAWIGLAPAAETPENLDTAVRTVATGGGSTSGPCAICTGGPGTLSKSNTRAGRTRIRSGAPR